MLLRQRKGFNVKTPSVCLGFRAVLVSMLDRCATAAGWPASGAVWERSVREMLAPSEHTENNKAEPRRKHSGSHQWNK